MTNGWQQHRFEANYICYWLFGSLQYCNMNGQRIFFSSENPMEQTNLLEGTNTHFQYVFKQFLDKFNRQNTRAYHRQIQNRIQKGHYVLDIELADLKAYDDHIYEKIVSSPLDTLKIMEDALRIYVKQRNSEFPHSKETGWQVNIRSDELPRRLRDISSNMVYKIFVVSGIIISATKPYIKATKLKLKCRNCLATKVVDLGPGQSPFIPMICQGQGGVSQKCPNDPFVAMPDSEVIDTQSLKLQQSPEDVPTGEIARTYSLVVDRDNVSRCVPGDRVRVTGIMFVYQLKTENLSKGYIYVTGIEKIKERTSFHYSEQEEEIFKNMSKDVRIKQKIFKSIAPGIYGNEEIKKAIACMLFGGSRKHLPDNTLLRGDINVLLIGDPSTAKSQFLKFVEQTSTIAVYTSGKGSSAAGLTASITKDSSTGQFQIEGGALVLADGGIVCIDQFDKMKPQDRVAIHQAMEQQTISVAKAGITTRLNSRVSVLAAANPIYGRYDQFKQISQQIQLQTTILSRFDCIFIVKDINTAQNNERIANHILDLHQGRIARDSENGQIAFDLLKKYIKYAKSKVNPRLSASASEKMQSMYVVDRQKANEAKKLSHSKNSIPITVRQLEALIRLSQSLARMKLRHQVTNEEVEQAHELFSLSTLKSIEGKEFGYEMAENVSQEIQKIEQTIRKRVCIGSQVSIAKLVQEMEERYSSSSVALAVRSMVLNGQFREIKGKKQVIRDK